MVKKATVYIRKYLYSNSKVKKTISLSLSLSLSLHLSLSPEIPSLIRILSPSFVSKCSGILYWAMQNSYDLRVSLRKSFSLERGKSGTTSATTTFFHADPLLSNPSYFFCTCYVPILIKYETIPLQENKNDAILILILSFMLK